MRQLFIDGRNEIHLVQDSAAFADHRPFAKYPDVGAEKEPAVGTTKAASLLDNQRMRTIISVAFTGTTALTSVCK